VTAGTPLTWDGFTDLPGNPAVNFELLWRSAVYRNYAKYGTFTARVQQPGVEFHLEIDKPGCPLGAVGRVFGWQTKWFAQLAPGTALSDTRKRQIVKSINATRKHWPNITDWVLVTKHPMTAGDQSWFTSLNVGMQLHQASHPELADLLVGDALTLREAYFGSLILTPERLKAEHDHSTARVKDRWVREVHQASDTEHLLRRILAQPDAWADVSDVGADIGRFSQDVAAAVAGLDTAAAADVTAVLDAASEIRTVLADIHDTFISGDVAHLLGAGARPTVAMPLAEPPVLRNLKSQSHPAAPALANLISYSREAAALIELVGDCVSTPLVVVSGNAGFGKTQLAAGLSAPTPQSGSAELPAGVFMEGRFLARRHTLDDFARQTRINGKPVDSFDKVLAAVDAAAQRAGARLPLVIDGLNEAEAPKEWLPLLRQLFTLLPAYPNVLVVCTIRAAFVPDCIPPELPEASELTGFVGNLDDAIALYFKHYKIDRGDAELPLDQLTHPLTLRIFCEVANPDRQESVRAESLPKSLTGMFDAYLDQLVTRVAHLHGHLHQMDVLDGIVAIGAELWAAQSRVVPQGRAKELLGDTHRRWEDTLLYALEGEGFLIRYPNGPGYDVGIVYDLLAGHVIARSLIAGHNGGLRDVMSTDIAVARFASATAHPLAYDIFRGLVGGMPRVAAGQLWKIVPPQLQKAALLEAISLEAAHIDSATVEQLAGAADVLRGRRDLFDQLLPVRSVVGHPLNATFLDTILKDRSVAERDLRWTEWLRSRAGRLHSDVAALSVRWQQEPRRTEADKLRARWLMWTLTSTDRTLRDATTAALHWYGFHDPRGLFELAVDGATINDPYILERMLAASAGVAMTRQVHDPEFEPVLADFLGALAGLFTGPGASAPASHALTRHYTSQLFAITGRYYPAALPAGVALPLVFTPAPAVEMLPVGDARRDEVKHTIRMDFGNYTLGRLFVDRRNYDDEHPGHQEATAHVLGVVYALGYRGQLFEDAERSIDDTSRFRQGSKIDRYGKKYGWIGFHVHSALMADRGNATDWLEVDIDPSFPQQPPPLSLKLPTWARQTPADDRKWLRDGIVKVPDTLAEVAELDGAGGPWVLTHAFLESQDVVTGRRTFGLFNIVLVDQSELPRLLDHLDTVVHPGRDLIDIPASYYTFAGEIPWSAGFAAPEPAQAPSSVYRDRLRLPDGDLEFEVVSHNYAWESYHSPMNDADGYTPGKLVAQAADLRGVAHGFDQVEPDGTAASRTFSAPAGFEGHLLYQRLDLLMSYAAGRAIVTFGWGERQTQMAWPERLDDTFQRLYQAGRNVWRKHWIH
jgi:hypothetical protein